jgi:gluconolactonase
MHDAGGRNPQGGDAGIDMTRSTKETAMNVLPIPLATRSAAQGARSRGMAAALLAAFVNLGATACAAADVQVAAAGLQFPEGTVFAGNVLYFVDDATSSVLRLSGKNVEPVWHQDGCGANGLLPVTGGLLVACYENGTVVRISLDGKTRETLRADDKGQPFASPNDLTADAHGGIYFSASGSESTLGEVFYRSAEGRVREVAANINYSNGLAVSPDGKTLYLAESEAGRLLAFAILPDGGLGPQREFVKLASLLAATGEPEFTPDGVRIDEDGHLFVGLYRGGGIAIISRDGRLLKFVRLPGAHHANLAISPDRRTIFVTSADDRPDGSYRGELLAVPNPIGP